MIVETQLSSGFIADFAEWKTNDSNIFEHLAFHLGSNLTTKQSNLVLSRKLMAPPV